MDSAAEDDTDDGSSAEGKEGDAQGEDGGQVGGGQSNSEVEQTDLGNVGSTVEAFDGRQDMVQQGAKEQHYYDIAS